MDQESTREAVLTEFGRTVATVPFNAKAVQKALAQVKHVGGKELAVEVCCTLAAFESVTRVVDATIRKKHPAIMMTVVKGMNKVALHLRQWMLAGGTAIAAVGIAVIVSRTRHS